MRIGVVASRRGGKEKSGPPAAGVGGRRRPVAGVLLGSALLLGCGGNEAAEPREVEGEERVIPVATARAEVGSITRTVGLSGVVEPIRRVLVNSQLSGEVRQVLAEEGDRVRAGALLARMDDRQLRAELESAEASHEVAEAAWRRAEELLEAGIITRAEWEEARTRRAAAEARLQQVRAQVGYTEIRAPIAGVVTSKSVEAGHVVSPQTQLFAIDDVSTLVVRVRASEMDVVHVSTGDSVSVSLDALPGRPAEGRIRRVFPSADPDTRLVPVEVALAGEAARAARPGFLVRVVLPLESREDVIQVPASAVQTRGGVEEAWVVEDGRARRREITTGLTFRGQVEVTSGLSEGDRVVTAGHAELRDGAAVRESEGRLPEGPLEAETAASEATEEGS